MSEINVTLNVAEIIALGGVIWGLARMSKSLDILGEATTALTKRLEFFGATLNELLGRVMVLEDRSRR